MHVTPGASGGVRVVSVCICVFLSMCLCDGWAANGLLLEAERRGGVV